MTADLASQQITDHVFEQNTEDATCVHCRDCGAPRRLHAHAPYEPQVSIDNDAELSAIQACTEAVAGLPEATRSRVLRYLSDRYGS